MREPDAVLSSLRSHALDADYKYERLYRNLYNPNFFCQAYKNISAGNRELDKRRINALISSLKDSRYQTKRSIFEDKLAQEIVRMILESIYQPACSNRQTALLEIKRKFAGTTYFINGEINGISAVDRHTLVNHLRTRIHDEAFIALIWKLLRVSDGSQRSIIGDVLLNIYLNECDRYIEQKIRENKRLSYVRHAGTWLCGIVGSKAEAEATVASLRDYLASRLKLTDCKISITHARDDKTRFLGYDICADKTGSGIRLLMPREIWQMWLKINGALQIKNINGREIFEPVHRTYLIGNDDIEILRQYNAEIREMYDFYRVADNVYALGHFYYVMKFSLFKTLAAKYKSSVKEVRRKYRYKRFGVTYMTKDGLKTEYLYDAGFRRVKN